MDFASLKSSMLRPDDWHGGIVPGLPGRFTVLVVLVALASLAPVRAVWPQEKEAGAPVVSANQIRDSIQSALAGEHAELSNINGRLEQLEILNDTIRDEIKTYDSENTAHGNLLLMPEQPLESLTDALRSNRQNAKTLTEHLKKLEARYAAAKIQDQQIKDRITLAEDQSADIKQLQLPAARKQELEAISKKLIQTLQEKKQASASYLMICEGLTNQIKGVLDETNDLGAKLAYQLENQTKTSLLKPLHPNFQMLGEGLRHAWTGLSNRIGAFFTIRMWKSLWEQIRQAGDYGWLVFLFWFSFVMVCQARYKTTLERIQKKDEGPNRVYRTLILFLLRRSLLFSGMVILFGVYSSWRLSLLDLGIARLLVNIFLVLLFTRWGLDYLKYGYRAAPSPIRQFVTMHLKRLFRAMRVILILTILLAGLVGKESPLIWIIQNAIAAAFLAWSLFFWHWIKPIALEATQKGHSLPDQRIVTVLRWWTYLVTGGGLLIGMYGYHLLAGHVFFGWIKTGIVLFWGWISLNAIREWHRDHRAQAAAADREHLPQSPHRLRIALIRLVRIVWFFSLAMGIVWAWDKAGILTSRLRSLYGLPFTIGSLQLSISGIVMAVLILYITNLIVRLGRTLLDEKILARQHLEPGFKDSLITITSYLTWALGLILALGVLGVNATSLAVVFGALSIGIGFGLQNIFNNFISGLILLFERPIQVGDYIEIGGLWAEVKEINVRATVVQTFDNASVLIPNSELISQQVTNWSFKDKRMRRNIEVGVAYGSDIGLVQKTLLEIADNNSKVYKYPRPDVLFMDHADSALIFRLRVWIHVDDSLNVVSQIRFEIDRRFRELGIEIAFPQRDLHIRTFPREIIQAPSAGHSAGAQPGPE